uniref:Uncharacterized protein n=1 Tax=Ananas comosus var. bracteatus TaxID=296719 RepID=A0A6V7Q9K1_ANACO|nr:unnamed protein product [Ananas comosus var. bracteatus]
MVVSRLLLLAFFFCCSCCSVSSFKNPNSNLLLPTHKKLSIHGGCRDLPPPLPPPLRHLLPHLPLLPLLVRSRSSFSSSSSSSPSCRIELSEFWVPPDLPTRKDKCIGTAPPSTSSPSPRVEHPVLPLRSPAPKTLKLAVFVKRWPSRRLSGDSSATPSPSTSPSPAAATRSTSSPPPPVQLLQRCHHRSGAPHSQPDLPPLPATKAGYIDQPLAWAQFQAENARGGRQFDVVHTESVALRHSRARNLSNLAASWHGIAYETIHSDVIQELLRSASPGQPSAVPADRLARVVDEVRFFRDYKHTWPPATTWATCCAGSTWSPRTASTSSSTESTTASTTRTPRAATGSGEKSASPTIPRWLYTAILVAGDGPWGSRYKELGPNMLVLGPWIRPGWRASTTPWTCDDVWRAGRRHVVCEHNQVADRQPELGYTFHPTVESLKESLCRIWKDGRVVLKEKGGNARNRAVNLFTATKMASAYERLFLCISEGGGVKGSSNKVL